MKLTGFDTAAQLRAPAARQQAGGEKQSAPAFSKALKAADGYRPGSGGEEKIVSSGSKDKRKMECARRFGGAQSAPRKEKSLKGASGLPVVSSIVHPTSPTPAREPDGFPHDFRSVAKPLFQICGDGQIRRIDDQARVPRPSSRRQPAVLRPMAQAEAALDVASAWKPRPARMRAEPTSHGFGITKAPGPS